MRHGRGVHVGVLGQVFGRHQVVVEVALDEDPGDFLALDRLLLGQAADDFGHFLAAEKQLDGDGVARVVKGDL